MTRTVYHTRLGIANIIIIFEIVLENRYYYGIKVI